MRRLSSIGDGCSSRRRMRDSHDCVQTRNVGSKSSKNARRGIERTLPERSSVVKQASRGEVWWVDLAPVRGHEPTGRRPGLVVSVDEFNTGPADLVVVAPMTSREKGIPFHVPVQPPEGGLRETSYVKCEDVRSVAKERLVSPLGRVSRSTMAAVEDRLRILLGI